MTGEAGEVMKAICMQLKVCEGCGALWVRALNHGVYCRRCEVLLAEFPTPRGRARRGRRPRTVQAANPMPATAL